MLPCPTIVVQLNLFVSQCLDWVELRPFPLEPDDEKWEILSDMPGLKIKTESSIADVIPTGIWKAMAKHPVKANDKWRPFKTLDAADIHSPSSPTDVSALFELSGQDPEST